MTIMYMHIVTKNNSGANATRKICTKRYKISSLVYFCVTVSTLDGGNSAGGSGWFGVLLSDAEKS